jgi:hypothetical protein
MRFMMSSREIRGQCEFLRAPGRRPSPGEGRPAGVEQAGADAGGVAADEHVGEGRRAGVEPAAAGAGAVAAADDAVRRQAAAVVVQAAAAIGPTAADRHLPRAVLTLIDPKIAEPPFSFG